MYVYISSSYYGLVFHQGQNNAAVFKHSCFFEHLMSNKDHPAFVHFRWKLGKKSPIESRKNVRY